MNKRRYILILLLKLPVYPGFAQENATIEGILTGFKDSTKLMITPSLPDMAVDRDRDTAIYLLNGKFRFASKINGPTKFSLRALPGKLQENPGDYESVSFWMANKHMTLRGEKGNLAFSDISGDDIQDEYEEFVNTAKSLKQINKRIQDSVMLHNLSEEARIPLRKVRDKNIETIDRSQMEFIYAHPYYYSCVAEFVFYINYFPENISAAKAGTFYQRLSDSFKNNIYGKQIRNFIDNKVTYDKLKTGDSPYNFSLQDSSGVNLDLASIIGKIILVDFWASDCAPCRAQHQQYSRLFEKFRLKGFEILSVSQDQSKNHWLRAMREDNMVWLSVWDADRRVTKMYRVNGIPANYLIGADGQIIAKDLGGKALSKKLDRLINAK